MALEAPDSPSASHSKLPAFQLDGYRPDPSQPHDALAAFLHTLLVVGGRALSLSLSLSVLFFPPSP